jgi:hypothetical protein
MERVMQFWVGTALVLGTVACTKEVPLASPSARQTTLGAPAPESEETTVPVPVKSAPTGSKVLWANIVTTEDCFFFSGPFEHGRDATIGSLAKLEISGTQAVLHLGDVRFDGEGLDGRFQFKREDEREYEGKWRSTERIEAELSADGLRGTYAYEECDLDGSQGCPGKCTMEADFFAWELVSEGLSC